MLLSQIWDGQIFEHLSCSFSEFGMGEFLTPLMLLSHIKHGKKFLTPLDKTDKFLNNSHASFTDLGWVNFLTPHVSFTDLGWASFLIPLTKTDKFLNTSHASFTDLGWTNSLTPLIFLSEVWNGKFFELSHAPFTDLGWANFLTTLAKTDKFLNTSHTSFADLRLESQLILINLITLP